MSRFAPSVGQRTVCGKILLSELNQDGIARLYCGFTLLGDPRAERGFFWSPELQRESTRRLLTLLGIGRRRARMRRGRPTLDQPVGDLKALHDLARRVAAYRLAEKRRRRSSQKC
jgi:hypothetical protein